MSEKAKYTGTPQRLSDVRHTSGRYTGQVHLDQRILDRGLSAPGALHDGGFNDLLA
jgi:hypothetical protein